jgi:hypothetical protein
MADGGIVPFELTVQILIEALIEKPSQVSFKDFETVLIFEFRTISLMDSQELSIKPTISSKMSSKSNKSCFTMFLRR